MTQVQFSSVILAGDDPGLLLDEAKRMASSLNCASPENKGYARCSCAPCRQIYEGSFPNWFTVAPRGKANLIQIGQIRELMSALISRAVQGQVKIAVFLDAHRMSEESQNALLKTLEEPPEDTLLLLLTSKPRDLLPTIRSRCAVRDLSAAPLSPPRIELELAEQVLSDLRERGYRAVFDQAAFINASRKDKVSAFLGILEFVFRSEMTKSLRESSAPGTDAPGTDADGTGASGTEKAGEYIAALRLIWRSGYLLERNVNSLLVLENLFLHILKLSPI